MIYNFSMKKYLGVDIGGTSIKIASVNKQGKIVDKVKEYQVKDYPLLVTTINAIDDYLSKIKDKKLQGIGISASGLIDNKKGVVVGQAGHVKNYTGSKIKETIEKRYKVKTSVINDAKAAALGEKWIGNAKKYSNSIVLTVGTGIGGGIIVDSKILNGASGFGGEVGHISIDIHGEKCYCGNRGCFEYLASTKALIRNIENKTNYKNLDGKKVFELIQKQDKKILKIYDEWLYCLAQGIVSMIHIFNPEAVIISGGISVQKTLFIEPLKNKIKELGRKEFINNIEIKSAKLKNNAGLIGAVYNFLQEDK